MDIFWGPLFCLPQRLLLYECSISVHIIYIFQLNRHYVLSSRTWVMFTNYQTINYNISSYIEINYPIKPTKDIHSRVLQAADTSARLHIFSTTEGHVLCRHAVFPPSLPLKSLNQQAHLCAQANLPTCRVQPRFAEAH